MKEKRIEKLISQMNQLLSVDGLEPSVSPTLSTSERDSSLSDSLYIDNSLNVERLSNDELILAHTLLHKLYASNTKTVSKEVIVNLHNQIKDKINHTEFDRLDRI